VHKQHPLSHLSPPGEDFRVSEPAEVIRVALERGFSMEVSEFETHRHGADEIRMSWSPALAALEQLTKERERDNADIAYGRTAMDNYGKVQVERDTARAEVERLTKENEALSENYDRNHALWATKLLEAERERDALTNRGEQPRPTHREGDRWLRRTSSRFRGCLSLWYPLRGTWTQRGP